MHKNGSAKLCKKANESINLFFNEVFLSRCVEDSNSVCTQFVTGLSLNHDQSIHS